MNCTSNAKIVKIIKDNIWIELDGKIHQCLIKGNLRIGDKKPVVGDNVLVQKEHDNYVIKQIQERKNFLHRPKVANIDYIAIVQSVSEPNFDTYLLDQMITYYELQNVEVIIIITKCDIFKKEFEKIKLFLEDYKKMNYYCFNVNDTNEFKNFQRFVYNKTICLAGNSGVGKTTLINKINPNLNLRTQEISQSLNRGKHTTTNTSIIDLGNFYLVDTPGYGSIQIRCSQIDLAKIFFHKILNKYCRFNDCLHLNNHLGCEIQTMLNDGFLVKWRYDNYLKMIKNIGVHYDKGRN